MCVQRSCEESEITGYTDNVTIFANHILNNGLVSKICKELSKFNSEANKQKQPN